MDCIFICLGHILRFDATAFISTGRVNEMQLTIAVQSAKFGEEQSAAR